MDVEVLSRKLIVSCQPVTDGPMDRVDTIVAMALAAVAGGAAGLRIEGVENVHAVSAVVDVPIVGIVKRDLPDSAVRITPYVADVKALADAGAQIIAVDATARTRPVPVAALLDAVHAAGAIAMADCATEADGIAAAKLGFEIVATTLSGYTQETETNQTEPDYALMSAWRSRGFRVVAEGRLKTAQDAARALEAGAFAVTVGSAITRVEHITGWFVDAMSATAETQS
ncbi:putative N-acetylmannosamine-6-phosphate 2-epimerase [Paraburkholderia sp.]|uniref:N-acetylmannosamine-6-phosphate 2-epimerase n=1 Tax=Paraburkholderia sp. TaxID=1926495 RepID=UPI0023A08199|nr:putative N-acetylmannosamine-6-phosphate 2-epimerase [Paraburkholderia sp.]MDE1179345.1 putative N-acetylmannosamine-6-phosphate 2-epimerase [Paraburkholderia sp.]